MTKNRDISKILDQNSVFTAAISVGSGTVNVYANSSILKLSNSTVNTALRVPTSGEYSGAYFLHANGTWQQVISGATPGGSDSYVQYNDGGTALGGLAGFTFNDTTNNVFIANTLTVGSATINSTKYSQTANNADFLGGVAAAGYVVDADLDAYQTEAGLSANVATLTANNTLYLGGTLASGYQTTAGLSANVATLTANNSTNFAGQPQSYYANISSPNFTTTANVGANVQLSTIRLLIGNATANLNANSILVSLANSTGIANLQPTQLVIGTSTVNTTAHAAGANVIVTTSGLALGNTTVNAIVNSNLITISNTFGTANLQPTQLVIGTSTVSPLLFAAGANVILDTVKLSIGETATFTANDTLVNAAAINITGRVNTATLYATTSANVGGNVQITTSTATVSNGGATQVSIAATGVTIANTGNTVTIVPPSTAQKGGSFYLKADGSWASVAASAGGSDTQVQFNDGGTAFGGSAGFTFAKASNNVTIANTLTVGTATVNSTLAVLAALNVTNQVNTATLLSTGLANLSALNVTNQTNTATLFVTTSANVGTAGIINSIGITTTGFVNAATVVNSASHTIGTTLIANTLGVYHTGIMNAASHTTSGITANTLGVYPSSNTVGTALGTTTNRWILTANTIESTGLANVNALNVVNQTNTATLYATTSANVGGNVQITTSTATVSNGGATQVSIAATGVTIANTGNTVTIVPPSTAQKAGSYYLKADGVWTLVSAGATPGGLDSYIQYNDGGSTLNGIAGFTLNDTTNNVNLANTLFLGGATVNLVANAVGIKIANSTVSTALVLPTAGQYSATNYFLHANGSWVQLVGGSGSVRVYERFTATGGQVTFTVAGGYTINQIEVFHNGIHLANNEYTQDASTVVLSEAALVGAIIEVAGWIQLSSFSPIASGSNTQVQFNDSTSFAGNPGFTFDKTTNNASIANTLTVGSATINSTNYSQTANNALNFGGTSFASFQLNSTLAANVATMTANNATWLGTSIFANSTGAYPTSNSVGAVLGNTISRVIITGNSATFSSTLAATDTTITGFVNATVSVNSAAHTIGSAFIANTLGVYHTGLMNAASYNATGYVANTTGVYHTGLINAASYNATGYVANTTGVYHTGLMNAASHTTSGITANATGVYPSSNTVGTALGTTTARWLLTANTIDSSGLATLSALNVTNQTNTATFFATTSANVGANVQLTTTQIFIGNSTANLVTNSTTLTIANSTGFSQINPSYMYNGNGVTQALQTGGIGFWYGNNTTNVTSGTITATTNPYFQVANSTGSANVYANGFYVGSSVVNSTAIGASIGVIATTLSAGNTSVTGFVNATVSVNSALLTVGTAFAANTTGAYHTGLMNAASFNVGTSTIVNSTMVSVTAGSLLSANIQVNPQTGTTYTLAATDSGKIVTMNNAGAMTVTLPAGLPIGFRCQVLRLGAGTCTLSNTGQTSCNMLSRTGTFAITAQYGSISVFQTATANTYIVDGLL